MNTVLQKDLKATQLERLLDGMIHVAAAEGFAAATIARTIAHAGVSRPTFYEYFAGRDECFLAAVAHAQRRLLAGVRDAVDSDAPERAASSAVEALVAFAETEPAMARVLMSETLAGGPRALDARDGGIRDIERIIEQAYDGVCPATVIPDLSPLIMLGAVQRVLACRLRREQPGLCGLAGELRAWVGGYERPAGEHRWRTLEPTESPVSWHSLPACALQAPPEPSRGRQRLSDEQVAEACRRRVLFALAEVVGEQGYGAATIAEITRRAGVGVRCYYRLFAGKQQAFSALAELYFQQMMAVTAGAFFTAAEWPERVWRAKLALARCIEQNPVLSRACFTEGYAEQTAVARVEHLLSAFTMFLQDGHGYDPSCPAPSRVAVEAVAQANFELVYHQARQSSTLRMAGVAGHATHLCLAPFMGSRDASELIGELSAGRQHTAASNGVRAHARHMHSALHA